MKKLILLGILLAVMLAIFAGCVMPYGGYQGREVERRGYPGGHPPNAPRHFDEPFIIGMAGGM